MQIKHPLAGLHLVLAISIGSLISGCGGGSGANGVRTGTVSEQNPKPGALPFFLTLNGTAATGRAIAAAAISAKCQVGDGSATTADDGRFQINVTGGTLPCLLQTTDPTDGSTLHSAAGSADGATAAATVNVTPLTEMLTARALGQTPPAFFAAFDPGSATQNLSPARLKSAQTDVTTVLTGIVDTAQLPADFATSPLYRLVVQ